jgi:hypothetical protein
VSGVPRVASRAVGRRFSNKTGAEGLGLHVEGLYAMIREGVWHTREGP